MFRITFFVNDKHLATAIRGLTGIALGDPQIQSVINAEEKGGKVMSKGQGTLVDLFADYVKKNKLTELDTPAMRKFCKSVGKKETSSSYIGTRLTELGAVKKSGKTGNLRYNVVTK